MFDFTARPLAGKKGVILGIANEHSIAYGCARAFRGLGADVAVTYTNDKARPFVEPLAKALGAPIILPCDVRVPGQLENVFQIAEQTWGKLDFALHSIASAPKQDLYSPLSQCSRDGFLQAIGSVLLFLHTHGLSCRANDARWGHDPHDDLPRRRKSDREP
jgi:enoyl-[acyl-carrier protein] reductase I